MANFYWLLVEGLYLHTLLVAVLPPSRCFLAYLLIGWGKGFMFSILIPISFVQNMQPSTQNSTPRLDLLKCFRILPPPTPPFP